eukprot:446632_1
MSYLKRADLKRLITYLKEYYGEKEANTAMDELIEYYDKEAFDDEDITNDWIPNDCKNSHGIDKFVESLNCPILLNHIDNKNNLFNWFCHWLLHDVPQPIHPPVHATANNNNISKYPIERVAYEFTKQLKIQIDEFKLNPQTANKIAKSFITICKEEDYTKLLELNNDFENIEDSFIVDKIMNKYPQYRDNKYKIFYMLQDIVIMFTYDNYPPFELKNFEYKCNENTFKEANKLCLHLVPAWFIYNADSKFLNSNDI